MSTISRRSKSGTKPIRLRGYPKIRFGSTVELIALADDATGALEVGAQLAGQGVDVMVGFEAFPPDASAVVMDLETRHVGAAQAEHTVARAALEAGRAGARHLYKKTDSTLRGNIAAEFQGLRYVYPDRSIVYVPAYPKMGRIVRDGMLFVHGKPLAETEFSSDPLNPAREGSLIRMFEGVLECPVALAAGARELARCLDQAVPVIVCDGVVEEDLRQVAGLLGGRSEPYIVAGPAGFVAYWAPLLLLAHAPSPSRSPVLRGLVVNGSLHPASREQVALVSALGAHSWVSLSTPEERAADPLGVARKLAGEVRAILETMDIDGLVIIGGDTVFAVLRELGVGFVRPLGELRPGIPLSRFKWQGRNYSLATKAGGFGGSREIEQVLRQLEALK